MHSKISSFGESQNRGKWRKSPDYQPAAKRGMPRSGGPV